MSHALLANQDDEEEILPNSSLRFRPPSCCLGPHTTAENVINQPQFIIPGAEAADGASGPRLSLWDHILLRDLPTTQGQPVHTLGPTQGMTGPKGRIFSICVLPLFLSELPLFPFQV